MMKTPVRLWTIEVAIAGNQIVRKNIANVITLAWSAQINANVVSARTETLRKQPKLPSLRNLIPSQHQKFKKSQYFQAS